jgi:hypothetical protein
MTDSDKFLAKVLDEATKEGDVLAPSQLLSAVALLTDPVRALSDLDLSNSVFTALDTEFSFLRVVRIQGAPAPSPTDHSRLVGLVRWMIRELLRWADKDDPSYRKLASLFVVAQCCDWNADLWSGLPGEIGQNAVLIKTLEALVSSFHAEFTISDSAAVCEQEASKRFQLADADGNWAEIAGECHNLASAFRPNALLVQMVRCLYRYGLGSLVRAVQSIRQTPTALAIAAALSVEQRLDLAIASANPYIQFGCAYETLSGPATRNQLRAQEQQRMTDLLLTVTHDGARWKAWMDVFNSYPARYPSLQVPLGKALATAPDAALEAYASSIHLYPVPIGPDQSRRLVGTCLAEFRRAASLERRRQLWTCAYRRWEFWSFDQANHDTHLFQISGSQLDYALVAYAVECIEESERREAMEAMLGNMRHLSTIWHESASRCITEWNRLLSHYQPYARAAAVAESDEDWVTETVAYYPPDATDEYLKLMFEII